jgi:two-component system cell cycle sensor histidine kinase/response regulator CckA
MVEERMEQQVRRGEGKILLMDDEEVIRDVAGEMLRHLGCEVEVVEDGEQAVGRYRGALAAGNPFEMVIVDLTVPGGVGGMEVVERLLKIDPAVKVIISSGYSNDPAMVNFRQYGFQGVVVKPFKLEDLSTTLQKVRNS